jgi:adenine deaminase
VGLLQPGDPADLVVVQDLKRFKVMQTYINGQRVAETGRSLITPGPSEIVNRFNASPQTPAAFAVPAAARNSRDRSH